MPITRDYRRLFWILSILGIPVSFTSGYLFPKNLFLSSQIEVSQFKEANIHLPQAVVDEGFIKSACATYLASNSKDSSPKPDILDINGFAVSPKSIRCVATIEKPIVTVGQGMKIESMNKWFHLSESRDLSLASVSESEFITAYEKYRTQR